MTSIRSTVIRRGMVGLVVAGLVATLLPTTAVAATEAAKMTAPAPSSASALQSEASAQARTSAAAKKGKTKAKAKACNKIKNKKKRAKCKAKLRKPVKTVGASAPTSPEVLTSFAPAPLKLPKPFTKQVKVRKKNRVIKKLVSVAGGGAGAATVTYLGKKKSWAAGATPLAFRVSRTGGTVLRVGVDLTQLAQRFGGQYTGRITPVLYRDCALAEVNVGKCSGEEVPATWTAGEWLLFKVARANTPVTVVMDLGSDSVSGDYRQPQTSPSDSWVSGGSSGSFNYAYPVAAPPAVGGDAPKVTLGYNSQVTDTQTTDSNGQSSWLGEGWNWDPGYVEQLYAPCKTDSAGSKVGDLCWDSPYDDIPADAPANEAREAVSESTLPGAVLHLGGKSTELIWDATSQSWHMLDDDGWHISRENTGDNDTNGNWWWRIRDLNGNEYWFGFGKKYSDGSKSRSVGRVPVYGDDKGEPCHASTDSRSDCDQGYQFHLDRYVDSNGNVTEFSYTQQMNKYTTIMGGVSKRETLTYTAGMYPDVTAYGMNTAGTRTPQATMDVGLWGRCLKGTSDPDPFTGADPCPNPYAQTDDWRDKNADQWPDTPLNLICTSAPCAQVSPTFFDTLRFKDIATTAGGAEVARTAAVYKLPANKASLSSDLWMSSIQTRSSAKSGQTLKTPLTAFSSVLLQNNVGAAADIRRLRIRTVTTAQGSTITAAYNNEAFETNLPCQKSQVDTPTEQAKNTSVCFPVWGDFDEDPKSDSKWNVFRRYVTMSVTESSPNTTVASAPVTTRYMYGAKNDTGFNTTAAWAWTNGLVRQGKQTWDQWRGYSDVFTTQGDTREATQAVFFRGMNGTKNSPTGGTRSASTTYRGDRLSDQRTIPDQPWLAGNQLQTVAAAGSSGYQQQWTYTGYTSVALDGTKWPAGYPAHQPRLTAMSQQSSYRFGANNSNDSVTSGTTYETVRGTGTFAKYPYLRIAQTRVNGSGIETTCTSTKYQDDTIFDAGGGVARVLAGYPVESNLWKNADCTGGLLSQSITNYDGTAGPQTPIRSGNVTHTKKWVAENFGECPETFASYDKLGRIVEQTAANGAFTKTEYSSDTSFPTQVKTTMSATKNAGDKWVTTATQRASDGATTSSVDVNGRTSTSDVDSLGRVTSTSFNGAQQSSTSYEPVISGSQTLPSPIKVTSRTVAPSGGMGSPTVAYFDGFGHQITSQTPAMNADGSSSSSQQVVTATSFNAQGLPSVSAKPVLASGSPGAGLAFPSMGSVPVSTSLEYDWLGQVTRSSTKRPGQDPLVTTVAYPNAATTSTSAPGVGTQVGVTDVLGRTVTTKQFKAGDSGAARTATFEFDRAGNMVKYNFGGSSWSYTYDQMGRRITATDPDSGATSYSYDVSSNVVSMVGASGAVKSEFDWLNRLVKTTDGDGVLLSSFTYDPAEHKGVLASSVSGVDGRSYTSKSTAWDAWNRPLDAKWEIPSGGPVPEALAVAASNYSESYSYADDGSVKSTSFGSVSVSGSQVLTGETVSTTFASGSGVPVSAATAATGGQSASIASSTWTGLGEVASRSWATGGSGQGLKRAFSWDPVWSLPDRVTTTVGNTPIADVQVGYSDTGSPQVVSDTVANQSVCHSYDGFEQLTNTWTKAVGTNPAGSCGSAPAVTSNSWLAGANPLWSSWSFSDDTGQPTQRVAGDPTNVAAPVTTAYTYGVSGHVNAPGSITATPAGGSALSSTSYSYDGAGRRAGSTTTGAGAGGQSWVWGPEGRPRQVTTTGGSAGVESFVYDTNGTRLVHATSGKVTVTLGATEISTSGSGASAVAVRQLSSGGALLGYRDSTIAAGAVQYTAVDVQGSGVIQANPATVSVSAGWSGRAYAPYGDPRPTGPASWAGDRGWLNLTHDSATNLTQTGARLYDRGLQQFISPDPLLATGLPNPYLYAGNNPIGFSDPSGLIRIGASLGYYGGPSAQEIRNNYMCGNPAGCGSRGSWRNPNRNDPSYGFAKQSLGNSYGNRVANKTLSWRTQNKTEAFYAEAQTNWGSVAAQTTVVAAAAVGTAAACAVTAVVGCIAAGVAIGAGAGAASYGADVALDGGDFDAGSLATATALGGALGAIPGIGKGLGSALKALTPAAKTASGAVARSPIDDVLSETLAGSGNLASATRLTADEALGAGARWVGPGYREIGKPGSGVFRSADDLRQFRMDNGSIGGRHAPGVPHVHFELFERGGTRPIVNNHVPFVD